jgi:hypothetical protein
MKDWNQKHQDCLLSCWAHLNLLSSNQEVMLTKQAVSRTFWLNWAFHFKCYPSSSKQFALGCWLKVVWMPQLQNWQMKKSPAHLLPPGHVSQKAALSTRLIQQLSWTILILALCYPLRKMKDLGCLGCLQINWIHSKRSIQKPWETVSQG